jgi:hypothetical protein
MIHEHVNKIFPRPQCRIGSGGHAADRRSVRGRQLFAACQQRRLSMQKLHTCRRLLRCRRSAQHLLEAGFDENGQPIRELL